MSAPRGGRTLPTRESTGKVPEPAVKYGAAAGGATVIVAALLALLDSLGVWNLSGDQQFAIITFVGLVAPIIAGVVTRAKVFALKP